MTYGGVKSLLTGAYTAILGLVPAQCCCIWWVQLLNTLLLGIIAVLLLLLLRQMYKQLKAEKEITK